LIEFFSLAWQQALQQSLLEAVAVLLSVAYVILAARQNSWCWPCAFVSTTILTYLFWETTLVFHMLLNAYYILMAVVGFLSWNKLSDTNSVENGRNGDSCDSNNSGHSHGSNLNESQKQTLQISSLSLYQYGAIIAVGSISTILLVLLGSQFFSSDWIWLDAGTTVFSVLATVLTARKIIDNWFFWLIINPITAYLVYQNGLHLVSLLMIFYTAMSFYGYRQWLFSMKAVNEGFQTKVVNKR
jgi:nicotinamide mononucleotide transporter